MELSVGVTREFEATSLFESGLCIDPSEVFALGWSYGGAMTYAVACAMPTVFRAVAVYSRADLSGCSPGTQPVPYLGFRGGSANVLPIADGEALLSTFVKNNGCTPQNPPVPTPGSLTHIVTTFSGCRPGYPVVFAAFDGGHTPDPVDGSPNSNGDTTWTKTLTWDFFSQFQSTIGTPPGNTVTVTSPGNQSGRSAPRPACRSGPVIPLPGRGPRLLGHRAAGGAVDQPLDRADLRHARHRGHLQRDRDRDRFHGRVRVGYVHLGHQRRQPAAA